MATNISARLDAAARAQATKNAPAPAQPAPTTPRGDFAGNFTWRGFDPRRDSTRKVINPMENSLLFSVLDWQATVFAQAPFCVQTRNSEGAEETLFKHPLSALVKNPLDGWSRTRFWRATLLSRFFGGTAYWYKIRLDGEVAGLQWLPHRAVVPELDPAGVRVIRYDYHTRNGKIPISAEDMVVIRDGIDPDNPHLGFSRYRALAKHVATDEESQDYENIMLHNLGVPGAVIRPPLNGEKIKDSEADKIGAVYTARTTGNERGRPMVFQVPVELDYPALSPAQFGLEHIHDYVESRVSMVAKMPASLLQTMFGAKNMNTKASVKESERQAWYWNIIPTQDEITEELDTQLLPELGDPDNEWCAFDRSQVDALREDRDALSKRTQGEWNAGLIDRAEARGSLGRQVRPEDEGIYKSPPKKEPGEESDPEKDDKKDDPQKKE
jgi:phage portal protein BeeE